MDTFAIIVAHIAFASVKKEERGQYFVPLDLPSKRYTQGRLTHVNGKCVYFEPRSRRWEDQGAHLPGYLL
jgi:hypothetical protein